MTQTKVTGSALFPFHQLRLLGAPGQRLESWSCSTAGSDEEHEQTQEKLETKEIIFLIKTQGWAFEHKWEVSSETAHVGGQP